MTYNAHLLLHMADSVRNWGPLWNFSAFSFESMNGRLLRYVQGTRYVGQQISHKYLISKILSRLPTQTSPDIFDVLFTDYSKGYKTHKFVQRRDVMLYGRESVDGNISLFKKMSFHYFKFCVDRLDKSRRNNFYARNGDVLGRILRIRALC